MSKIQLQKITLKSNRILYLNSIIIHMGSVNGGHYVTFFRKDKSTLELTTNLQLGLNLCKDSRIDACLAAWP